MTSEFLELQESMNNVQKTNGKSTLTVRGSAKVNTETGDFQFAAYQQGEPVQKNVRRTGCCTVYETDGKKESSIVAHLRVRKDTVDPFNEMWPDFVRGMKPYIKDVPKEPTTKALLTKENLNVWLRRKDRSVCITMNISLDDEREPSTQLFNLTSEVNKCLVINEASLKKRKL